MDMRMAVDTGTTVDIGMATGWGSTRAEDRGYRS
jgi:hypothetical protein